MAAPLVLISDDVRQRAIQLVREAPAGYRVTIQEPKRSIAQNDALWAALDDLAESVQWHGVWLSKEDWKLVMLDALKREMRIVPNIDGTGFVNLGRSTSKLSKDEMSGLIELIYAFGSRHGVMFKTARAA